MKKTQKEKKQIFYRGHQHILQIIIWIGSLKIHFCSRRTIIKKVIWLLLYFSMKEKRK